MAPPEIVITPEQLAIIEGMAMAGSPNLEIARATGIAVTTLKRRCGPRLTKQRALRRVVLRQAQLAAARKGNPAMLIWLGKQELGQRDVVEYAPLDTSKMSDEELEEIASGRGRQKLRLHR